MLFLLNDRVLNLNQVVEDARASGKPLKRMSMPQATRLGQELYAAQPQLQHSAEETALRLAALITAADPSVNAALFVAPAPGCSPKNVLARVADVDFELIARLARMQMSGPLSPVVVNHSVWRKLAA